MAGDIYTMTPGSAVADNIQQILQRRREESRQALMDKLDYDNVNSDIAYRQGNLKLAQDDQLLKELMAIPGGADPNSVAPKYAAKGRELGHIRQRPAQAPTIVPSEAIDTPEDQALEGTTFKSGVEQPFLPGSEAGEEFVGDKDYQKRTSFQTDIDAMMGQFKDDPDTLRALMLVRNGATNNVPDSLIGPKPSFTPINPDTGRAGERVDLPRGGDAGFRPYAPASYTPAFMPWFDPTPTKDFPQGRSILVGNRLGNGGQPIVRDMPSAPNATGPQQPLQRVAGPDQTPDAGVQTAINNLRTAAGAQGPNTEQAVSAARSGLLAAASRSLTPAGHAALMDVVTSFQKATRPPTPADVQTAIAVNQQRFPNVTPAERQVITDVLNGYLSVPLQ